MTRVTAVTPGDIRAQPDESGTWTTDATGHSHPPARTPTPVPRSTARRVAPYVATPHTLPPTFVITHDDWVVRGRDLARMPWRIGDWYNTGAHYGWGPEAAAITGLSTTSLRHIARVARNFNETGRYRPLSFSHYAEVVAETPTRRTQLLDLAERQNLSSAQLRAHIRANHALERAEAIALREAIDIETATHGTLETRDANRPVNWPPMYRLIDPWNAYIEIVNEVWHTMNAYDRHRWTAGVEAHLTQLREDPGQSWLDMERPRELPLAPPENTEPIP
jgi:hypothetical protein